MKNFSSLINESKEKPLFTEWEIKGYFDLCMNRWLENMRSFNIASINGYQIIQACKQCEIALELMDKFADDIQLHFYSLESEEDKKKYGSYWTQENNVYNIFTVIEQLSKIDFSNTNELKSTLEDTVDVKKEVSELKSRLETLAKKCNDKWHASMKNTDTVNKECEGIGCAVPCSCDCCKCSSY